MTQTASAVGHGITIVQIQGHGNSVDAGQPHLTLTRHAGVSRRIRKDSSAMPREIDVVRAFTRSIKLIGRQMELKNLREWLHNDLPISVRVITGDAGVGKTRLAFELIEEMAAGGWYTGFLTRSELTRFRQQHNLEHWGWNAPVLAVVDYASAGARDLHAWLKELAQKTGLEAVEDPTARPPLRLLLLERHATRGEGWWRMVFGRGQDAAVLEQLADPVEPVGLQHLNDVDQRRMILKTTLACLESKVTPPEPSDDAIFDQRLATLDWAGVPLLLMMAAATAARKGFGHVLSLSASELAIDLAEEELSRIFRVVQQHDVHASEALTDHVAAVATLRQGLDSEVAGKVIEEEGRELGYTSLSGPALLDALAVALPDGAGGVARTAPDMIGEALLLTVWKKSDARATAAVLRAYRAEPTAVVDTIVRTCQDYLVRGYRQPLGWLQAVRDSNVDLDALNQLSNAMPKETLALREVAVDLAQTVAEWTRPLAYESEDPDALDALARNLNNLSHHLAGVHRRGEALTVGEELVALCRSLATERPDIYRPRLAVALNNLSTYFSELGRYKEAFAAAEEAISLYRDLAKERPDAFRPDLAMALCNLGTHYSELRRYEAALTTAKEATSICRGVVAERPGAFEDRLATTVMNLANRFSDCARHEDALAAGEEAAKISRGLDADCPDAFRSELAKTLRNLSNLRAKCGKHAEALAAGEEAVKIYRQLADDHFNEFGPDLGGALNVLRVRLLECASRRYAEAVTAGEEAVEICRRLADERPDEFRPVLARLLKENSDVLSERDRREEAGEE